jgi:hypothetical protein
VDRVEEAEDRIYKSREMKGRNSAMEAVLLQSKPDSRTLPIPEATKLSGSLQCTDEEGTFLCCSALMLG